MLGRAGGRSCEAYVGHGKLLGGLGGTYEKKQKSPFPHQRTGAEEKIGERASAGAAGPTLGHVIGRRGKYISKPASGIEYSAKSMLWAYICEFLITAGPLETLRIGLIF
jgi:hypothetical protein